MKAPWYDKISLTAFSEMLRAGIDASVRRRNKKIVDRAGLESFLDARASYVSQTSLYGYLRTRAGTSFPVLFEDDLFVESINIAKWHVWLSCLADLSVYTGGLVLQRSTTQPTKVGEIMVATLDGVLARRGVPPDAGGEFQEHAARVRDRIARSDWAGVSDDAVPFSESETALVHWSPVVDDFKRRDEPIVRNSIRFLWPEVRRELRRDLDADALLASEAGA